MDPEGSRTRDSTLGRLLQELSWAGAGIRRFRDGGLGYENVLTAEVFTALDFLPRESFLGAVLKVAHGADAVRWQLCDEIESAQMTVLPDELLVGKSEARSQVVVQPDAIMTSPSCYVLVEAKRIRRSAFQPEQLAREYLAVLQHAGTLSPLLLLLLPKAPPVLVKGHGRLEIHAAIASHLAELITRTGSDLDPGLLLARLPDVVAWTTWDDLRRVVEGQREGFVCADASMAGTLKRLVGAVTEAVDRHS